MKHLGKKLLLAGVLAGLAATAAASNPFTDVDRDSWAYQSVSQLADDGVVVGYPDGSFKGDKNITRYELAQIVARLRERDDLTEAQRADVSKLSSEYSEELKNLGVRVSDLEKKASNTQVILEARFHYMPVYNNVFNGDKEDVFGARIRLNTVTRVNERFTLYGQLQTKMSLGGTAYHDMDYYDLSNKNYLDDDSEDGKLKVNRLFMTYHFGGRDGHDRGYGPARDVIAIGMFPCSIGNTGYTYDGQIKGASVQFGDAREGGRLTLAYGNATNINYNYTAPMMRGIPNMSDVVGDALVSNGLAQNQAVGKIMAKRMLPSLLLNKYDEATDTYFPKDDVRMTEGEDADVPVAYASYVYKNPNKYEIHLYGMKACGPVNNIAKAYGFALSYNITPKWRIHGEFAKNLVKLPLNDERPHSWNYGISYGTADVLKAHSFSIGVDYVYSKAGTYFGGSSSDVADQYMGHVYSNWHGQRMPAYVADKMDDALKVAAAKMQGVDMEMPDKNYGGAKFYLAKVQYVPVKGLILEAQYGFGAEDMGGRSMDNIFRIQATMYYK